MRHIWVLGDEELDKSANILRKLANQHIFDAAKPELYMHREYNVEAFHDSEVKYTYNNILRKVRNNLTAAFNKYPTVMPEFIIVLMGNSYIHDHIFVEFELKAILKKVLSDITRLVASRREQLPPKVLNVRPTQVYWMRPLPKPAAALKGDHKFKNTRRYVNQMLDNLSRTCGFKPLNIDEINCSQKALFEANGLLSDFGKERMWCSISEFIKNKDTQFNITVQKGCVSTEEAATQVKPDMITSHNQSTTQVVEEYFTSPHGSGATESATSEPHRGRRARQGQDWSEYSRRDSNFDDYHRFYDRGASHYERNEQCYYDEHYNY